MRVNQKIWHIEINNAVCERSYRPNGVRIKELKIIGISEYKICINTDWFTTMDVVKEGQRKDRSYKSYLDDVSTSIRTADSILDEGVFLSLYSTKKPNKKMLQKMVASAANEINKKYGFLLRGVKNELYDLVDDYKI